MQDALKYRGFNAVDNAEAKISSKILVTVAVSTDEHHRFLSVLDHNLWLAVAVGILSTAVLGWVGRPGGDFPGT